MRNLKFTTLCFLFFPLFAVSQSEEVMEAYHLQNAIKKNDIEKVEQKISEGADINYQFNGRNALHAACDSKSPEMVKLILDAGVNVNDRRDKGEGITTLQNAIRNYRVPFEIIEMLLDHGAKVNVVGPQGYTPLQEAIMRSGDQAESLRIALLLINHGAKLDPEDESKSAVLRAAMHSRSDMLELFLKNGADPNKHTKDFKYPIHYAVSNKDVKSVQLLKQYKADLNVKDQAGKTALDYANDKVGRKFLDPESKKKYQAIADLLSN